jgi:hypothetical protein
MSKRGESAQKVFAGYNQATAKVVGRYASPFAADIHELARLGALRTQHSNTHEQQKIVDNRGRALIHIREGHAVVPRRTDRVPSALWPGLVLGPHLRVANSRHVGIGLAFSHITTRKTTPTTASILSPSMLAVSM